MATPEKKPLSLLQIAVDLAVCAAFFLFFYRVLQPHVPSTDRQMVQLWAALGSACMTGVFWLALNMVRAVWRCQRGSPH